MICFVSRASVLIGISLFFSMCLLFLLLSLLLFMVLDRLKARVGLVLIESEVENTTGL